LTIGYAKNVFCKFLTAPYLGAEIQCAKLVFFLETYISKKKKSFDFE